MTLSDKLTIPAQIMAREGRQGSHDFGLEQRLTLDLVGARIWQLIAQGQKLPRGCDHMLAKHDVAPEDIKLDVFALTQTLLDKQLSSVCA